MTERPIPREAIWPLIKRWADSYEYGHLPGREAPAVGNSWTRAEQFGGGTGPWKALAEASGRSEDWFRDIGRKPGALTFEQVDWILAFIGRPDAWYGELAEFYPQAVIVRMPPNRARRYRNAKMDDNAIRNAHKLHVAGMSVKQLSELLWERYGYKNAQACQQCMRLGFKRLGLRTRTRAEFNKKTKTKHGLLAGNPHGQSTPEYRRWLRRSKGKGRPCKGFKHKNGKPCKSFAVPGSEFCFAHSGGLPVEHLNAYRALAVARSIEVRRERRAAA